MVRVCFVCLGNICRSPTAEGVFVHLLGQPKYADLQVEVDSAGTGAWHAGERPDARARRAAKQRGIELPGRARQFRKDDFAAFDFIMAMDRQNLGDLVDMAPDQAGRDKIHLFRDFDAKGSKGQDVPDPYYGGDDGFGRVLDICDAACRGLLAHVRETQEAASR